MAFNGDEGGLIPLQTGIDMTTRYRDAGLNSSQGVFIGSKLLQELLDPESGAKGIRFYFGLDEEGLLTLVLAGANGDERDLLGKVGNKGCLCPPYSDMSSPLFQ
ncbi:hypothetical protein [Hymenobacter sp. B81]|uniref:hypothetical protein n=1 Tax=Hymenobacter sp. B81 TaxID=3344878 RepID=UPI0037DC844D